MSQPLLVALGVLALLCVCMLALTGLRHAFGKFMTAIVGFVVIFAVVFFGTSFVTGTAPPMQTLTSSLQTMDFWKANLGAAGLGFVLAAISARILLTRRA